MYSIRELGLLDQGQDGVFENIVKLAHQTLGAPVALVSVIDDANERQVFKARRADASRGLLGAHLMESWYTPLSHSLCNEVRIRDRSLIVQDMARDPSFRHHPAVTEYGVLAYIGAPIHGPANDPIGAVCAMDNCVRIWSEKDRSNIETLADLCSQQVLLRAALQTIKRIA
ncbi:GAF domain-containing protein [Salipiger mucosus]|nr:GAF domain-containing protein [Salipiger mucosus]